MTPHTIYRRILRRETHSPRTSAATVVVVLIVLALAWYAVEIVLSFTGQPPLLLVPADAATTAVRLDRVPQNPLMLFGIIAAIVGILLIVAAVSPGRRARHHKITDRSAVVVDNRVIASAFAARAASAAGVGPDQVRASVGHRRSELRIVPTTGIPVYADAVQAAVSTASERDELRPRLRSRVTVAVHGVVGA